MGGGNSGLLEKEQVKSEQKREQRIRAEEDRLMKYDYEHLVAFNPDGTIAEEHEGDGTSVDPIENVEGKITMHNHPVQTFGGISLYGGPPSVDDVYNLATDGSAEMRVVTRGWRFALRRTADASTDKAWKFQSAYGEYYEKVGTKIYGEAVKLAEKRGLSEGQVMAHVWHRSAHMCRQWLKKHAKDYGFEYSEQRR